MKNGWLLYGVAKSKTRTPDQFVSAVEEVRPNDKFSYTGTLRSSAVVGGTSHQSFAFMFELYSSRLKLDLFETRENA